MKLLLDTHTFLWFIGGNNNLSNTARNAIENATNQRFISIATLWEKMTTLSTNPKTSPKLNYDVLIEQIDGNFIATALGLLDCQATGTTKEQALQKLTQLLTQHLANAEIVSLEIEPPKKEHPWMKFAGMFKDDPQFDEMMELKKNCVDDLILLDGLPLQKN